MPRKTKITLLLLAMGISLFSIYIYDLFSSPNEKPKKVEFLGNGPLSAPLFTLPDLRGNKVDLISFQGKVVVIEFWATWCGPCRAEIPYLNELYKKYKDDGLVVIGISLDRREPQAVQEFLEKLGAEYINLMGDQAVFDAYSNISGLGPISGIPATFLIDRQGRIRQKFAGLTEKKVLEEAIRSVL